MLTADPGKNAAAAAAATGRGMKMKDFFLFFDGETLRGNVAL